MIAKKSTNNLNEPPTITVIGAGLTGSECAYQLAQFGFKVRLIEMRLTGKLTAAHKTQNFAELVCSNSFGSLTEGSAPALLKWEAEQLDSIILKVAKEFSVPAGQALGIDREKFSARVTQVLLDQPNIEIVADEIESIDQIPRPSVICTGPLTSDALSKSLLEHFGGDDFLYFFDAIAPIIAADSIDTSKTWMQSRWDKGSSDYINCPLTKDEYYNLVESINTARKVEPKEFEKDFEKTPYFESCLPVEVLAERGKDTLRFGPLKPVGLTNPHTGTRPYAVVQLRQDNLEATAYNMVGFQTKMAYPEQQRVFRMIPGLENAEFYKLGSIHRNLYINSPKLLSPNLSSKKDEELFFAGQITGVEGYFESTCIGLLVANFIKQKYRHQKFDPPPLATALGSLLTAITTIQNERFQPTNINFGLLPKADNNIRDKSVRKQTQIERAKSEFLRWIESRPTTF